MFDSKEKDEKQLGIKRVLIDLINSEISLIESEQRRPGWTSWALLGTLATLAWVLIKNVPLNILSWETVGLIFFPLIITVEFFRSLYTIFTIQKEYVPREPRFISSPFYGVSKFHFVLILLQGSVLLFISITMGYKFALFPRILSWLVPGIIVLTGAIALVLSYLRIPQRILQNQKTNLITSIVINVLILIILKNYWALIISNVNTIDQSVFQAATLLALIYYVLVLLGDLPQESPLLASLISIRRDLALDKIEISWAKKQLDIAFSGMRVEDLLQDYVQNIISLEGTVNGLLKQQAKTSEAILGLLTKLSASQEAGGQTIDREAARALVENYEARFATLKEFRNKLWDETKNYFDKANKIMSIDERSADAINEVTGKLNQAQEESKKMNAAEEERRTLIRKKIESQHIL